MSYKAGTQRDFLLRRMEILVEKHWAGKFDVADDKQKLRFAELASKDIKELGEVFEDAKKYREREYRE